jgi:hypothetical protein
MTRYMLAIYRDDRQLSEEDFQRSYDAVNALAVSLCNDITYEMSRPPLPHPDQRVGRQPWRDRRQSRPGCMRCVEYWWWGDVAGGTRSGRGGGRGRDRVAQAGVTIRRWRMTRGGSGDDQERKQAGNCAG